MMIPNLSRLDLGRPTGAPLTRAMRRAQEQQMQMPRFRVRLPPDHAAELRNKRANYRAFEDDDDCADFETMLTFLEERHLPPLFYDESWRRRMWKYCYPDNAIVYDPYDDAAFQQLEDDMRSGLFNSDVYKRSMAAERELLEWLMEEDLDNLGDLLDAGHVHVGANLFERHISPHYYMANFEGGDAESLLAMAAKDVCSPEAVRFLLDRGADPNSELVHLGINVDLPMDGPGALAWNDINDHWCRAATVAVARSSDQSDGAFAAAHAADTAIKVEILTALANAGGEISEACRAYHGREGFETQFDACEVLFDAKERADRKRRWENVVALVGILSFWRRWTYRRGSRAAQRAAGSFFGGE